MTFENTNVKLVDLSTDVSYGYTASANTQKVGPKFLRITDIQGGVVDWDEVPYCEIDAKKLSKNKLNEGDIVVARTGNSTGENYLYSYTGEAVFASYLIRFRINPDLANPYFVWLQMRGQRWWDYVAGSKSGSAQAGANAKVLGQFEFFLPDRKVQDDVANIFLGINEKIKANTQTNQTLEQIAQAIFKSWFVDFEPVKAKMAVLEAGGTAEQAELAAMSTISAKDEAALKQLQADQPEAYAELTQTAALFPSAMIDSELGEIPEGWDTLPLDEIAYYQNGLALQKFRPKNENEFLPVVKISQLKKGFANGEEKASPNIKPECIIDDGDVVFSWSGSLVVDIWCGGKAALNQHLFKVTSETYPKWFYYYFTKHHLAEFQRIAADKAVTMGHIKREHLASAKCAIPTDYILLKGTELIDSLLEKQIEQRLETNTLVETRDSLLPKLLSGELTIPSTEEA